MSGKSEVISAIVPDTSEGGSLVCPVCFSNRSEVALQHEGRSLLRCPDCGAACLRPWPSEVELEEFFSETYCSTNEDIEIRFGTKQHKSLRQAARFINNQKAGGEILDVGCAGGYFLDVFFAGDAWRKWAIEPSRRARECARQKGIRIPEGDLYSAKLSKKSFSVITVLDTFYYLREPYRALDAIRGLLRPGGLAVFVMVCSTAHIWRRTGWRSGLIGGSRTAILRSSHLILYDPKNFSLLLQRAGFRISSVRPWPATGQGTLVGDAILGAYECLADFTWMLSARQLMLAPRFFVAATPNE